VFRFLVLLTILFAAGCNDSSDAPIASRAGAYQAVTGEDGTHERESWDALFRSPNYVFGTDPNQVLKDNLHLLPKGKALVLPMEEGRNAVYLAQNGFSVVGVDFSTVAISKAKRMAREKKVLVTAVNADLTQYEIEPDSYQVIVDIDFHHPKLIGQIKKGLKKGGLVVYEGVTVDQPKLSRGKPYRRDTLLKAGELKALFGDFEILSYREGQDGDRAVATIIARKPH